MNSIFIKTQYGVIVELRQWGQDKSKWLDWNAREWQQLPCDTWESTGWGPIKAKEIGRWNSNINIYDVVALAADNKSGFRNFNR